VEKQIRESEAASLSKDPCNLNFSSSLIEFQPLQPQENVFPRHITSYGRDPSTPRELRFATFWLRSG